MKKLHEEIVEDIKKELLPEMKRVECKGVGDNNGFYEMTHKNITVDDILRIIKKSLSRQLDEIVKIIGDEFPESKFMQWNNLENEWECILKKTDLKELLDKLKI